MAPSKYPQRTCRQPVWGEADAAHSCDLKVDNLGMSHPGPCASHSVPASMQRRHVWENSEEGKAELQAAKEAVEQQWTGE
jgi:hypothetical protein